MERDLNIYELSNVTGLEVDIILEFGYGEYAEIEIKLGFNQFDEAKEHLLKFQKNITKKPKFICEYNEVIVKDPETGIYLHHNKENELLRTISE